MVINVQNCYIFIPATGITLDNDNIRIPYGSSRRYIYGYFGIKFKHQIINV